MQARRYISALLLATAFALHAAAPSPAEAIRQMRIPNGFEVTAVASEPDIRQPLSISFDSRGRMWVIQYLQYPAPAGLKAVSVDQYLRTKYDRVPEPPPNGPQGADRITICEDHDRDGIYEHFKDFVSGLNLASGLALGQGGVFIVQPPYLLYYPDKNRDDQPDGPPEVLLTGFGMEDSHAVANSLTWGPDGWLYGAQGSTVTARIRGIEFQQGVWRYHPVTREFELFAEGGGNTWGLDFNEDGELVVGTNFGEVIALHQVQGGYYVKGFAKHGPLHNPHTYGYLDHVPYTGWKGGRVVTGGVFYHGAAYGPDFEGVYIGANLLRRSIDWHRFTRDGSTFRARHGGSFIETDDETFRPVDCTVGPDGAVYIADWCDARASHVDPVDNWDKKTGRIYRISKRNASLRTTADAATDLRKSSPEQLVTMLTNANDWTRRQARTLLVESEGAKVVPQLRAAAMQTNDALLAVQSFWTLLSLDAVDPATTRAALRHPHWPVRAWAIRHLGDRKELPADLLDEVLRVARQEASPNVRAQLACSARRWPAEASMQVIHELLGREEDISDRHIPLLLWWAFEDKAISHASTMLSVLSSAADWDMPLMREQMLERIARRYASETNRDMQARCMWLLKAAPKQIHRTAVLRGIDAAWQGQRVNASQELKQAFVRTWSSNDVVAIRVGTRMGIAAVERAALDLAGNASTRMTDRVLAAQTLAECGVAEAVPALTHWLSEKAPLQTAAIAALQQFSSEEIAAKLIQAYPKFSTEVRTRARVALISRATWARQLVAAVDAGTIHMKELSTDQLQQIIRHNDAQLTAAVEKRWGRLQPQTSAEKISTINTLKLVLNPSGTTHRFKGDATRGKAIYQQLCGTCHQLFNEGSQLGPELTGSDRKNTAWLLSQVIDPSAFIRPEYVNHNVQMKDGRSLSGLISEQSDSSITLVDAQNQKTILSRAEISELAPSALSLMPEGLLEPLTPEQVRDLFSYLQQGAGQ